jgi:hypothetical protein
LHRWIDRARWLRGLHAECGLHASLAVLCAVVPPLAPHPRPTLNMT